MKRKKTPKATDGGSRVALAARLAPGGRHGRRKPARGPIKAREINNSKEGS